MCNLFSNTMPAEAMRRVFDVSPEADGLGNQPALPAIFPRHETPVVRREPDGSRSLAPMHWGFLMPQVSKKTGQPILPKAVNNARDDKLATSRFWRESFETRRCLIPGTSFCEAKGRQPATYFWFALTGDAPRPPMAFAGLWRRFRGRYRDAEPVAIDTVTMITTTPNALVRPIHPDRMPAILPPEHWATWLDGPHETAIALIRPYPAEGMRIVLQGLDARADPGTALP
jgi:putative SOS response-associated peptidase YedK